MMISDTSLTAEDHVIFARRMSVEQQAAAHKADRRDKIVMAQRIHLAKLPVDGVTWSVRFGGWEYGSSAGLSHRDALERRLRILGRNQDLDEASSVY